MKITKVCCQGCGADLEIDESVRFVTCNYCHTRLEVVHDTTVTHTRLLDKIERTTDRMAANMKVLELQNDLERIDREWDMQRETLLVRNQQGHTSKPSAAASMIGGVIAIVFGIFWMSMASRMPAGGIFPLFGLIFIGVAVFSMIRGVSKAAAYRNQQDAYHHRRRQLITLIDRERRR